LKPRRTPALLVFAELVLGGYVVLLVLAGLRAGQPLALLAGAGLAALAISLWRGRLWAFLLTSALGIVTGLLALASAPALTVGAALIVIPLLASRRYFAGPDGRGAPAAPPPARFCPHCGRELTRAAQAPCPVCAPQIGAPPK